jgi:hypothetical protein
MPDDLDSVTVCYGAWPIGGKYIVCNEKGKLCEVSKWEREDGSVGRHCSPLCSLRGRTLIILPACCLHADEIGLPTGGDNVDRVVNSALPSR